MEDRDLLRLLYRSPSEGMSRLMDLYTGLVYAVVKRKLSVFSHISSDIEDCVADVFSKFYMNLSDYDPSQSSIKSYLCVLARNQALNLARKRSAARQLSLDDEQNFPILSNEDGPEDALLEKELRQEMIRAVEDLGQPDSVILVRKFYYGQSSKEIASAMGMTVSNVDTRTARALNKLKKLFGGKDS